MMKVLFVSHYLSRNGTEAFMMNVFRNIDRNRFKVDFLCFSRMGMAYEEEITRNGSIIYVLPERNKGFRYYQSLDSFFKEHRYNIVHWCIGSCTTIAPLFYAWRYHVPIRIVHSHSSSCTGWHNRLLHYTFKPLLNRLATKRLACSDKAGKWNFGNNRNEIVKNGVDVNIFSYDDVLRKNVRKELGIPSQTVVIGHVGRFDENKNHSFLLEAFLQYREVQNDSVLMLVGKGSTKASVEKKVRELNLEDIVMFLGERTDVPQLLQAMDLFVMPSLFEGLPYVLVEAQAAGLPCVVSDTVDPLVKITPNVEFMSLSRSADEWAEAFLRMLENFRRVKTDQYVIDNGFSIERTAKKLEALYSETK